MKGYAPQRIIDAAAFMVAKHLALNDWSEEDLTEFLLGTGKSYRDSYQDDNTFERDVRECANYANEVASTSYLERADRADFLRYCFALVRDLEPDGSRRKKFLGFLGGTRFSRPHDHPADRQVLFRANCIRYMAMAHMSGYMQTRELDLDPA